MLVGRARALALADALVADAATGRGRVLLIAGEAGIGKTALAREIVHRAEAAGAEPHWGACFEGASLLPYGVWIDCLRHPPDSPSAGAAARLDGGETAVADLGTDAPAVRQQRLRLFHDVVGDLRAASAEQPQALVLDDLHWADRSSIELLGAVAAAVSAMPVLVVATYRDDELDPGAPLTGIGGGAERLPLAGLGEDDVAHLLADGLGRQPSPDEVRRVHRQTGGNPLFVTQMARLAHHRTGGPPTVPIGLRDVLARRLARASSWCHRVLGAASVVGADFDLTTLAAVLDEPDDRVVDAIDEAVRARLIVPSDDEPNRWRFVHELIRSARYDLLGANERRAGHRRVTEVFAARGGVPAGVLAHHAALGAFDRDDLRPATYGIGAAREALRRLAWDEAVTLARRALRSAPPGPPGDELRGQAWLALGDALLRSGDDRGAGDAFAAPPTSVAGAPLRTSSPGRHWGSAPASVASRYGCSTAARSICWRRPPRCWAKRRRSVRWCWPGSPLPSRSSARTSGGWCWRRRPSPWLGSATTSGPSPPRWRPGATPWPGPTT